MDTSTKWKRSLEKVGMVYPEAPGIKLFNKSEVWWAVTEVAAIDPDRVVSLKEKLTNFVRRACINVVERHPELEADPDKQRAKTSSKDSGVMHMDALTATVAAAWLDVVPAFSQFKPEALSSQGSSLPISWEATEAFATTYLHEFGQLRATRRVPTPQQPEDTRQRYAYANRAQQRGEKSVIATLQQTDQKVKDQGAAIRILRLRLGQAQQTVKEQKTTIEDYKSTGILRGKGRRNITPQGALILYKTNKSTSASAVELSKTISIVTDFGTGKKENVHRSTIIRCTRNVDTAVACSAIRLVVY